MWAAERREGDGQAAHPVRRVRNQRGVASVWGIALIPLLVLVSVFALGLARAAAGMHRVDGAADLAAVAGAQALQRGADACAAAGRIARANGAEVLDCRVLGVDLIVHVRASVELPFGVRRQVNGAARAGPG